MKEKNMGDSSENRLPEGIIPGDLDSKGLDALGFSLEEILRYQATGKSIVDAFIELYQEGYSEEIGKLSAEDRAVFEEYAQGLVLAEIASTLSSYIAIARRDEKYQENIDRAQEIIDKCRTYYQQAEGKFLKIADSFPELKDRLEYYISEFIAEKLYK